MTKAGALNDWNPGSYARFRDHRLRPGLDLLNAVDQMVAGDVVDLGCGNGALGEALKARASGRRLIGVDGSEAMLEKARANPAYDAVLADEISRWSPAVPPALIYSNAVLHWLPDHRALLPRLAGCLARGGALAVQLPRQNNAPSHRVWLTLAQEMFPDRDLESGMPGALKPVQYEELLAPLGRFRLWETEYYQRLSADEGSHPVRRYTESTFARPILAALNADEKRALIARYEEVMQGAYPVRGDGSVLFPFRRMFFVLSV